MAFETGFFPNNRRELTIQNPAGLCNTADERRIKFSIKMPIKSEGNLLGMPGWIFEGLQQVEKAASGVSEVDYDIILDPMTLEFYGLEETETRSHLLTGAKLGNFAVKRDGTAEDADIVLTFQVHTMHTKGTWDWLGEIHSRTVFAKFTATQPSLDFAAKEPEIVVEEQEDIFSDPNPEAAKEACSAENDVLWEGTTRDGNAAQLTVESDVKKAGRRKNEERAKDSVEVVRVVRPRGFGRPTNASAVN